MKKKTKIIISISASFIILLGLLGLTYGYYISSVNGNTNSKSLLVTSAKLQLDYGQETSTVKSYSNLEPGNVAAIKYFTAKNSGDGNVTYSAILDSIESTFKRGEDLTYTLTCTSYNSSGFTMSSSGAASGTINGSCSGVSNVKFPLGNMGIMVSNTITPGHTHYYKLTINYLSKSVDQSVDMGANFSAKVNIIEPDSLNPYTKDKNTLAYNIINNALIKKNGKTEFLTSPVTIPAQETSEKYMSSENPTNIDVPISTTYQNYYWTYAQGYELDPYTGKFNLTKVKTCKYNDGSCHRSLKNRYIVTKDASTASSSSNTTKSTTNLSTIYRVVEAPEVNGSEISMKVIQVSPTRYNAESTLTTAPDDWGTSYYYRGGVTDNYLELNNMCFRIVRIQGDGSIKVTLANEGPCSGSTTDSGLINDGEGYVFGYTEKTNDTTKIYTSNYEGYTGTDGLYINLTNWYNIYLKSIEKKLKKEPWCLAENSGIKTATYKCSSKISSVNSYIGTLTADEVLYAGGYAYKNNISYYLNDNAQNDYWLLTFYRFNYDVDYVVSVFESSVCDGCKHVLDLLAVRPAVTIATGAEIQSGDGTINNPYKIK